MINYLKKCNFVAIQKQYKTAKQGNVYLIVKYGDYQNPGGLKGHTEIDDKGQSEGHSGAIAGPYPPCGSAKNVAPMPPHKVTILQEEKKEKEIPHSSLTLKQEEKKPEKPNQMGNPFFSLNISMGKNPGEEKKPMENPKQEKLDALYLEGKRISQLSADSQVLVQGPNGPGWISDPKINEALNDNNAKIRALQQEIEDDKHKPKGNRLVIIRNFLNAYAETYRKTIGQGHYINPKTDYELASDLLGNCNGEVRYMTSLAQTFITSKHAKMVSLRDKIGGCSFRLFCGNWHFVGRFEEDNQVAVLVDKIRGIKGLLKIDLESAFPGYSENELNIAWEEAKGMAQHVHDSDNDSPELPF
jgi:hypothetical protein